MRKSLITLLILLFLAVPFFGQDVREEILALRTIESIIVDGKLDEPMWKQAPEASAVLQQHSERQDPQKIKTSVRILYDDTFLYIGVLCNDTEPDKIIAGESGQDIDLRVTDSLYVLLDSFQDINNFYVFSTNVVGAKSDSKISKDGSAANINWNGSWEAFSLKTDSGWSTEIAIELSSIFEEPGKTKTFGIRLSRLVPRLDSVFWSGHLEPAFVVDELMDLKVLDLVSADEQKVVRRTQFSPYVMAGSKKDEKIELSAGLDVQYAFSRQISGQLTINPDFSTVEPDHERVNLTPFELYLPEQRDFFLSSSDIYQQQFGLFYSKRIGDIYGGVKLNGNIGAAEVSLVSVQTKKDQFDDEASTNFSVLRLKDINIIKKVKLGFTVANKLIDKQNKGTAGIDAEFDVSDKIKLLGQFALSYGDFGNSQLAFFLGPRYDSTTFHIHLFYKQIDENFGDNANEVGFIPDDNHRELDAAINKTIPFSSGMIKSIRYRSNYNIYWGMDGVLRSWQIDEALYLDSNNNFSFSLHHTLEYKLNDFFMEPRISFIREREGWVKLFTKDFRNSQTSIRSEFYKDDWSQFSLTVSAGKNYGSNFHMFTISKKFELMKNFFSEYDLNRIQYTDQGRFQSTTVHVLKFSIYAGENLFFKIFIQSNKEIDKANFQVVCTYTFKPPYGIIQVVYQKGSVLFHERDKSGPTLFLKLGYTF